MKRIFIVNPVSGDGKSIEIAKEIKVLLDSDNENYEMYYTSAPKEAIDIAARYNNQKEPCIIYSVGGDGTLFEVVNGVSNSNNILGIIPAGTGNDFIKCMNNDDEITYVDLGKMNEHYFINIASVGIDCEIANNQAKMKNYHIPKSMRYKASILYTLFQFKSPHLKINIDEEEFNQNITMLAICNGKYYGGGFAIAPNAKYDDEKFDIYLVDQVSKIKIPGLFLKLINGKHEDSPYVHKTYSNKITIHSEYDLNCNLDGEIFRLKDMNFALSTKKMPVYTANDKVKKLCKKMGLYK